MNLNRELCLYYHQTKKRCNSPITPKGCSHYVAEGRVCKSSGLNVPWRGPGNVKTVNYHLGEY